MTISQTLKEDNLSAKLILARRIALELAQTGPVTTDHVAEVYKQRCNSDMAKDLGPAAGSIFRTKNFEPTGRRFNSVRESNHSRELREWRLVDTQGSLIVASFSWGECSEEIVNAVKQYLPSDASQSHGGPLVIVGPTRQIIVEKITPHVITRLNKTHSGHGVLRIGDTAVMFFYDTTGITL